MRKYLPTLALFALVLFTAPAQADPSMPEREGMEDGAILLTVFLKHDQSRTINEIIELVNEQKLWEMFPPEGTTVVSWYVIMGVGQVVTLEVPAEKLRAVNLAVEKGGWKAFRTEFYPTYNLYPAIKKRLKNKAKKNL